MAAGAVSGSRVEGLTSLSGVAVVVEVGSTADTGTSQAATAAVVDTLNTLVRVSPSLTHHHHRHRFLSCSVDTSSDIGADTSSQHVVVVAVTAVAERAVHHHHPIQATSALSLREANNESQNESQHTTAINQHASRRHSERVGSCYNAITCTHIIKYPLREKMRGREKNTTNQPTKLQNGERGSEKRFSMNFWALWERVWARN